MVAGDVSGPDLSATATPGQLVVATVGAMSEDERKPHQCIERRNLGGGRQFYSVFQYAADMRKGKGLRHGKARAFHGVVWTEVAPEVQELRVDWQKTSEGELRICDWDLYEVQMRQLIGLDPRPADSYLTS